MARFYPGHRRCFSLDHGQQHGQRCPAVNHALLFLVIDSNPVGCADLPAHHNDKPSFLGDCRRSPRHQCCLFVWSSNLCRGLCLLFTGTGAFLADRVSLHRGTRGGDDDVCRAGDYTRCLSAKFSWQGARAGRDCHLDGIDERPGCQWVFTQQLFMESDFSGDPANQCCCAAHWFCRADEEKCCLCSGQEPAV